MVIRLQEFKGIAQSTPHSFLGFLLLLCLAGSPERLQAQDNFELGIRADRIEIKNQNETRDTIRIQQLDPLQVQASSLERDLRTIGQYHNLVSKKWLEWQNFGHLGEVAQAFSSAYVQTNGPGSLALIAQRGLSSSRTQLIWRGFGLNHPMLGVTDVSLLSSELFDGVVFSPGFGNSRYGQTGAGSVHLLQDSGDARSDVIQYGLGSFGTRKWSLGIGTATEKTHWDLRFHESTAANDFLYQKMVFDPAQKKIVQKRFRREHNETEKRALMLMVSH
ncbi:MAG: Plug domain-containing protein, partial [Bacteroidetes bacterium]|nr:Plug domain-containing protein [Bacteroidota bacterium]